MPSPHGVDTNVAPLIILAALIGIPILEISVIVQVGHLIGAAATVTLLVATSLAGTWLLRHEGARAWRALTDALAQRRAPHRQALDGALVLLGGTLMLLPGFVTDLVGLLCLLPPTRRLTRRVLGHAVGRRDTTGVIRVRSRRGPAHPQDRPGYGRVIDGELVDHTDPATSHRSGSP